MYKYISEEHEKCEKEILRALDIHPLSKTLLREHANFLWNVRKSESRKAYEKVTFRAHFGATRDVSVSALSMSKHEDTALHYFSRANGDHYFVMFV